MKKGVISVDLDLFFWIYICHCEFGLSAEGTYDAVFGLDVTFIS
jgi:hypothetical protein